MKLEDDQVKLVSYSSEHIPFFERWRRYYGNHFFGTLYPSLDALKIGFEKNYLPQAMAGTKAWWIICPVDADNEDPVGMIGLNDIDPKNGAAEIGQMLIIEQHRNQGYMRAAIDLVLELAFSHLRLNCVYLWTWEENVDAIKSYERAGFIETGRKPEALYRNQHFYDLILMSQTRSMYHANGHA